MTDIPNDRAVRCLDIAIDHRIRALFSPISKKNQKSEAGVAGLHLEYIQRLANSFTGRDIPDDEIYVTQKLSGDDTGGIAAILLQPSDSHPYDESIETIIEECPTYTAIDESFCAASCGTLLMTDISIIDSLPFVRKQDQITSGGKGIVRKWVSRIIETKKPDVILCMWQDAEGLTPEMSEIRSLGVGRQFNKSTVSFGSRMTAERVNAFHPSYAVNFKPSISCFRQLLLLEVTKSCRVYDGNWNEQNWMSELRDTCRIKASSISYENPVDSLSYLLSSVGRHLDQLERSILRLARPVGVFLPVGDTRAYDEIIGYNMAQDCNDVSLCIRKISDLDRFTTGSAGIKSLNFLRSIISTTRFEVIALHNYTPGTPGYYNASFLKQILDSRFHNNRLVHTGLLEVIRRFLRELNNSFEPTERKGEHTMNLERLPELFLSLAEGVEGVLGKLLQSRSRDQDEVNPIGEALEKLHLA
ncbi:hypothetical protein FQN54_009923 [Arachnomyces sp. PD_36]|nr:hypothetical protein FQN54_009923 [Arachnomyces sp. PD_36]